MSLFDRSMLPLSKKDAPKGVITAKGTMSYEDFAKKELTEYHQHGTVSDLLAVIGIGGKPSRDWSSLAAESTAIDKAALDRARISQNWDVPKGVVRENFGNLIQDEPMSDAQIARSVVSFRRAHRIQDIDASIFKVNTLIQAQTVSGITPSTLQ
jgi:hypothetical protein